jgi:hypothetical protein
MEQKETTQDPDPALEALRKIGLVLRGLTDVDRGRVLAALGGLYPQKGAQQG